MKNSFKWLGAIALLIMGTFMFVSCGDEDDDLPKIASKAQIVGTWYVQNVIGEGPRVGSVIIFNSDGTAYAEGQQGSFTYDPNTGAFTFQMQGMSVAGTITISNSQLTVNYTTGEGETGTMVLGKSSSQNTDGKDSISNNPNDSIQNNPNNPNDSIQNNPNDSIITNDSIPSTPNDSTINIEPSVQPGIANVKEMIGSWISTMNDAGTFGDSITFYANGLGYWSGNQFGYNSKFDGGRIKCELYFADGRRLQYKFVAVQGGNVLNGKLDDDGDKGFVLQRAGYTIPSNGILGRWQITGPAELNNMEDGPKIGMVLVFGENGELYIEGDAHIDSYNWNPNTNELYLSMVDAAGVLSVRGNMVKGAVAVWTLGENMRVELKKL